MSDQDRISPYNINTISIRQVVRIFVLDIFSIGQTKKFTTICIPTDWNFPIFENSTLFSRTKRKERKDVLKLWEISWPQNISLEILQHTACVSLNCVPLSTVFIVINEPCVYVWVCLGEDNIQMRGTRRQLQVWGWIGIFHPATEQNCSSGDRFKRYCYNRKSSAWFADRRGSGQWCGPSWCESLPIKRFKEAAWHHSYSYCWSDRRQLANIPSWEAMLPCIFCSVAGLGLIVSKWFFQNSCASLSDDVATNSWLSSWLSHEDWCIACRRPMFQRYHLSVKTFGATSRSKERSGDDRTYP